MITGVAKAPKQQKRHTLGMNGTGLGSSGINGNVNNGSNGL